MEEKNKVEKIIEIGSLRVETKSKVILDGVDLNIFKNNVNTIVGPSGSGKSTLLKALNRLLDLDQSMRISGDILFEKRNVRDIDPVELRRQVGLVFQKPNPFPMSVYDNVAFGLRVQGVKLKKEDMDRLVSQALGDADLFEELGGNLKQMGTSLSGGQQQRLCIARALVLGPKVLMFDEPTSALDPIAKGKIVDLIRALKQKFTVVLVTHDMGLTRKVSDYTNLIYEGKFIAKGTGAEFFESEMEEVKEFLSEAD
ncbi:MAG: ATP-binding cassette domain-containing protein [Candidatus Thermoplasmatota archaeon]|jgi:phosphate transport system ATP-binding protein|nr:ATP-binding cassette domain-containing protein [Candidatus Thermoplasmatota archaeon]MCL5790315.1 ATP-binding cassette domain-containing protein [Candidatus Thermoplasmatota archaeon]